MPVKRVFITGASGFIGQALVERLLKKSFEIHCLRANNKDTILPDGVKSYVADLRDYDQVREIIKEVNPNIVIHLAARTEVEHSFYEQITFSEINYVGTVNLIESCRDLTNFEQFIFASTMETYGAVYSKEQVVDFKEKIEPFDEDTIQHPNAPYAVAKVACEKYLEYAGRAFKFPYTILRQTNTYGRYDNDFFVVEQFITQMLKDSKEVSFGYKDPWRNFLYIDDLIDLYEIIIDKPDKSIGEIFCTGPNNALSIEQLAKLIAYKLDWHGKINWDTKRKRDGEIYYLNSINKKAFNKLGWQPKVSLDEGLDRTIKLWKQSISK